MKTKPKKAALKQALAISRKRFNSTIKVGIVISPAYYETLEKRFLAPMQRAASAEARSNAELRPATKALASFETYTLKERRKFILECTLRTIAGKELTKAAEKIIYAGKKAKTTSAKKTTR